MAVQAVDVPKAQAIGRALTQAARGQIQLLQRFNAAKYARLQGQIKDVKAGRNAGLRPLWQDAQIELEAVRNSMNLLAKFSKQGNADANKAIEAALQHATAQCRVLADIMDGK